MKRQLKRVIIPVVIITLVIISLVAVASAGIQQAYRRSVNAETARLLGVMLAENPEIDTGEMIQALQQSDKDSENFKRGEELLRSYGYLSSDIVAPSAAGLSKNTTFLLISGVSGFALIVVLYFCFYDWREERKINQLVTYLQNLKERIYDLKLEENSEDELSLLTNEIYKITVLLKEAAENNRLRSQNLETALADISHQLRTPLTSLQVMIDNIYDDPDMPLAVRQDFLRGASRQIESMSALVMTLLNLAKFDNGSIKLHSQPVQAGELLKEVRQNLSVLSELDEVSIELTGALSAEAKLDRRWQREALTNIVKNCIEHSPSGSKVHINVTDCPLFLNIIIKDEGEGIAQADLHHIFERFYKAKNSAAGSVGIGLAFAKTVIEADHGQISVKSRQGEGTTFDIKYFK